jgi:hypothetical protein
MGVDWTMADGKQALYQAMTSTVRLTWDDVVPVGTTPPMTLMDVSDPNAAMFGNFDPIMYIDYDFGRSWNGGLYFDPSGTTGCSQLGLTDDYGASWTPIMDACSGMEWDHESVTSGPWPPGALPAAYPRAVYYCAQLGSMNCWESYDGGITFEPVGSAPTGCGGLHGHIRVSRYDGTAYLPNKLCSGSMTGFLVTTDAGNSWDLVTIPWATTGTGRHDPAIWPTATSGWIYFGQTEKDGAYIGLSKDNGLTWEDVGTGNGAPVGTKWFNVAQLAGLTHAELAEVIAGDDDRAAFAFLGTSGDVTPAGTYPPFNCSTSSVFIWHMYVAMTYDAGKTWTVEKVTTDPVQRGNIWPSGGGASCRNLLDFNDIVSDVEGRVMVAYTDGCIGGCAASTGTVASSTSMSAAVARMSTGRGLFAAFDKGTPPPEPKIVSGSITPEYTDEPPIPSDGQMPPNDADGDGLNDAADNCAAQPNDGQGDLDGDGVGDACDADIDGDDVANLDDNCAEAPNAWQQDLDHDMLGDPCDPDADGDGLANTGDDCALAADAAQLDEDHDGLGDACDEDRDGDGIGNELDAFPDDATRWEAAPDVALPPSKPLSRPVAAAAPVQTDSGSGFPIVPVALVGAILVLAVAGLVALLVRRRNA